MNLYVKKIVSLNPDRYDYILLEDAHKLYMYYLLLCTLEEWFKDFNYWLQSEI